MEKMNYSTQKNKKMKQTGFTLIELMIVVIIIGIISAVAVPSYNVESAKRSEATTALEIARGVLERSYSDNNTYAGVAIDTESGSGEYTIAITVAGDGQSYDLTATPQGWTDADCGQITLASTGIRGADGDVDECWTK